MKNFFYLVIRFLKRMLMATLLAYMIAWHNVYKEETRTPNTIEIVMQEEENVDKSSVHF
jgi:hypothetical protein